MQGQRDTPFPTGIWRGLTAPPSSTPYVAGMTWAQDYAALQPRLDAPLILKVMAEGLRRQDSRSPGDHQLSPQFLVGRGTLRRKVWVTWGAVQARTRAVWDHPGQHGARSFIVAGKGHPIRTAPAATEQGRRRHRGCGKRQYSIGDLRNQTTGVECRKGLSRDRRDPSGPKDIYAVMAAQGGSGRGPSYVEASPFASRGDRLRAVAFFLPVAFSPKSAGFRNRRPLVRIMPGRPSRPHSRIVPGRHQVQP